MENYCGLGLRPVPCRGQLPRLRRHRRGSPMGAPACWGSAAKPGAAKAPAAAFSGECALKERLLQEFNQLGVPGMDRVTDLNALPGSYINLEYTLPGGQKAKFWEDGRVYLGNQICKGDGSGRCFGLTADENWAAGVRVRRQGRRPGDCGVQAPGKVTIQENDLC